MTPNTQVLGNWHLNGSPSMGTVCGSLTISFSGSSIPTAPRSFSRSLASVFFPFKRQEYQCMTVWNLMIPDNEKMIAFSLEVANGYKETHTITQTHREATNTTQVLKLLKGILSCAHLSDVAEDTSAFKTGQQIRIIEIMEIYNSMGNYKFQGNLELWGDPKLCDFSLHTCLSRYGVIWILVR